MLFVLNLTLMKMCASTDTEEQAFYLADILAPGHGYLVNDMWLSSFKSFSIPELRRILDNHNKAYTDKAEHDALTSMVLSIAKELYDSRSVSELHAVLRRPPAAPCWPTGAAPQSEIGAVGGPTVAVDWLGNPIGEPVVQAPAPQVAPEPKSNKDNTASVSWF